MNVSSRNSHRDFKRIEKAIQFICDNFQQQPSLEKIAAHMHLSPFHFQRLFTDWAGISPKQFLQYLSVSYAKQSLRESKSSLLKTSIDTGLSGTSRLHDLFIKVEGMTPGEYKREGESLTIFYQYLNSAFGMILVASTEKGICYMGFVNDEKNRTFLELYQRFPNASFIEEDKEIHQMAANFGCYEKQAKNEIRLHIKGTKFQIKVWEALLKIPLGHLNAYGDIAVNIDRPKASRAVGTAIGSNPVAFLIPCHRVIRASGVLGNYMWGQYRKSAMIAWEAAQVANQKQ